MYVSYAVSKYKIPSNMNTNSRTIWGNHVRNNAIITSEG